MFFLDFEFISLAYSLYSIFPQPYGLSHSCHFVTLNTRVTSSFINFALQASVRKNPNRFSMNLYRQSKQFGSDSFTSPMDERDFRATFAEGEDAMSNATEASPSVSDSSFQMNTLASVVDDVTETVHFFFRFMLIKIFWYCLYFTSFDFLFTFLLLPLFRVLSCHPIY